MSDSPHSGTIYRFDLIYQSQPLTVEARLNEATDEVEILSVEGPPIYHEDLLHLLKTSILPRTG